MNPENVQSKPVVTRFAPSPTGSMHIGGVRTALYNYLYARKYGGKFILRIEDTDEARNKEEATEAILESFEWLGLEYDELYKQSDRKEIYREHLERLVSEGKAYVSAEVANDDPTKTLELIRLKNPGRVVVVEDLVCGEVKVDTTDLGDFIIARDLNSPMFHFANVVDDHDMGVTHIIRAQEHLSNTPRQILIREALGFPPFVYAHIPLVLAPDRTKLSKRNGATNTLDYRDMGYLPEALLNFLALIGWNPGTEQEIFNLPELIQAFSIERVQSGGGIFNVEKLDWVNREHIRRLSHDQQYVLVEQQLPIEVMALPQYSIDRFRGLLPIIIDRIAKLSDVKTMWADGELTYFFDKPQYVRDLLFFKKTKFTDPSTKYEHLSATLSEVANLLEDAVWDSAETIKQSVWEYAESVGRGDVLWPMRVALTGVEKSPDPFTMAFVLGRDETLARIGTARELLLA